MTELKVKTIECDYLIIGSGAGGSSVADYLVESGLSVLMLEEGKDYSGKNQPVSATDSMTGMWRGTGLTPAFGSPTIAYAEARCVGGGTEINSGILQRVPESVLNEWSNIDNNSKDFYSGEIDQYYNWVDSRLNASILDSSQDRHSQLLKEAAEKQGWKVEGLPRAMKECTCRQPLCICGGKQSMTATLLKNVMGNPKFRIQSDTRVTKLVLKNDLITEVFAEQIISRDETLNFKIVPHHVFLCAGTIHSPHLLMKSDIKFTGLGRFQLHPTLKLLAHFKDAVNAARQPLPNYAVTEFMPDIRFGGSVVSPGILGMALAENWSSRAYLQEYLDYIASYYVMIRPSSWGSVRSLRFFKDPLVTYTLDKSDIHKIAIGTENLARALFDIGAITLHPSIKNHAGWNSLPGVHKDLQRKTFQKNLNLMSIHLFGSCSPRNNPKYLTGNGRINGIRNLVLADGSCLPSAPGVNPQATIMSVARHNVIKYCKE